MRRSSEASVSNGSASICVPDKRHLECPVIHFRAPCRATRDLALLASPVTLKRGFRPLPYWPRQTGASHR